MLIDKERDSFSREAAAIRAGAPESKPGCDHTAMGSLKRYGETNLFECQVCARLLQREWCEVVR